MSTSTQCIISLLLISTACLVVRELEYWERASRYREPLTIYVQGEVLHPQTLSLAPGSRRIHALSLCGGVTSRANLANFEPAKELANGETLTVPTIQPKQVAEDSTPPLKPEQARGLAEPRSFRLNINLASVKQLVKLPGIGPVLAGRIVELRSKKPNHTFTRLEDLTAIRGINKKTLVRLRPYLELEGI